jgi:uncharacterized protein YbbC (DUF1343 family)
MVKTGLDLLFAREPNLLKGTKLGLLVNPASVNSRFNHIVDLLIKKKESKVTTLFGPQHGIYGETQDNMVEWEGYHDDRTGLKVFSLYGKFRKPTKEMLEEVDVILVDLQDCGARYYTFIWTLYLFLEAAAKYEKRVVILDRPNPINGTDLEGPVLEGDFRSFVGLYPLPPRHGMTIGELALLFSEEAGLKPAPTIIKMEGWKREMWFDETRLPWIMPSPNMPSLYTAIVYPGMCLLEGTNLSEGRGTTRPFEIFGAPWIDPWVLTKELNKKELDGVSFRPLKFIPTFQKFKNELCGGAQLHVQDRKVFRPFLTAVTILQGVKNLYTEEFRWREPPYEYEREKLPFDILAGSDHLRVQIEENTALTDIEKSWHKELEVFRKRREKYLLY